MSGCSGSTAVGQSSTGVGQSNSQCQSCTNACQQSDQLKDQVSTKHIKGRGRIAELAGDCNKVSFVITEHIYLYGIF